MSQRLEKRLNDLHAIGLEPHRHTAEQREENMKERNEILTKLHGKRWFDDAAQPSDPITPCNPDYMTRDCDSGL